MVPNPRKVYSLGAVTEVVSLLSASSSATDSSDATTDALLTFFKIVVKSVPWDILFFSVISICPATLMSILISFNCSGSQLESKINCCAGSFPFPFIVTVFVSDL